MNIGSNSSEKPLKKILHPEESVTSLIFFLAIITLISIGIISYQQINKLLKANAWVIHTYQVMQDTNLALYNMIDIETHQRAYLITSDPDLLKEQKSGLDNIKISLDHLLLLTHDNPGQHIKIQKFSDLVNQRIDLLLRVAQLRTENKLAVEEACELFHKGQILSDRTEELAKTINDVEQMLLQERNNAAVVATRMTNIIFITGSCVSVIFLLLAFFLSRRELINRVKAEQEMQILHVQLNSIITGATDMIAAMDTHYRYIILNESYQKEVAHLFGVQVEVGMTLQEAFKDHPEAKEKLLKAWTMSLQGHEMTRTIEFPDENNNINTYEITSNPIEIEKGKIVGAVHIIRNITKRMEEQNALKASYEALNIGMQDLKTRNEKITLLVEMSDIMLACSSLSELSEVIAKYCERILNFSSGLLYIMHPSKNYLEITASWGVPSLQNPTFTHDNCWAIRLGKFHQASPAYNELLCPHISDPDYDKTYLCIPLMAQNDIFGLLYLEVTQQRTAEKVDFENDKLLINAFAELAALALANVRLRENLHYQSIRDPLTKLYNRRYLEDFLMKQLHKAKFTKSSLTVLMLDLDYFKSINDMYGHDAGDIALKEMGQILEKYSHGDDLAARYGGEEFIVILYNLDLESAKAKAEGIRKAVAQLQLQYGAQQVGSITVSIGMSQYPADGETPDVLIEIADKALYHAKNTGKNKVVTSKEL